MTWKKIAFKKMHIFLNKKILVSVLTSKHIYFSKLNEKYSRYNSLKFNVKNPLWRHGKAALNLRLSYCMGNDHVCMVFSIFFHTLRKHIKNSSYDSSPEYISNNFQQQKNHNMMYFWLIKTCIFKKIHAIFCIVNVR